MTIIVFCEIIFDFEKICQIVNWVDDVMLTFSDVILAIGPEIRFGH